ncbi:hypothetical protein [Desulfallas thermosapovorans]|uniref:Uncharacterized protein n=1 Tax=Desulfallas thermosapovorans DSM 6562 TaxID=1121431 RepID=A0A5S4ZSX3_9FIRM|nr:hypothetical protein [Desulfallas thermosapovorans]TYO95161.1 hypothetical protein LX24_01890 [Desulfallas thermosapovorans DSM 6562]
MNSHPLLLVQKTSPDIARSETTADSEIIAIAIYGKNIDVPVQVTTQRIFEGEVPFRFPTEITRGTAKCRIVYRYTLAQWRELLETTTMPASPAALKQLMIPMLLYMQQNFPDIFKDIEYDREFNTDQYAELMALA